MRPREFSTSVTRYIAAPPDLVWALMSDTNRWDRSLGLTRSSYSYEEVTREGETRSMRVGSCRYRGFPLRWLEIGEWVESRFMCGERVFLDGLIDRAGLRVEIEAVDDGTRITATGYTVVSRLLCLGIGWFWIGLFWWNLRRYLRSVQSVLHGSATSNDGPPSLRVQKQLLAADPTDTLDGPRGTVSEQHLRAVATRLKQTGIDKGLCDRIESHVRDRPDDELGQIRPFELARAWDLEPRDVLRGFLEGCRVGLLELHWQLNCPACRVAAGHIDSLATLTQSVHCSECDIAFDTSFADNVEAVFRPSPRVRVVESSIHCAGSPWFRPHVYAMLVAKANATRHIAAQLPRGRILVRALGRQWQQFIGDCAGMEIAIEADGIRLAASDESGVVLRNDTDASATLLIERADWTADIVRGSMLLTMPEFLDLFATDAPATGADVSVGRLALVFTDLIDSTQMYEQLGDSRAYALVQEHFNQIRQIVSTHEGAVVKTMGDAVMAVFATTEQALTAAIDMIWHLEREGKDDHQLAIRVGLAEGPCLMVGANDRIDFFGKTVNVAARLQGCASANHIVVLEDMLGEPGVMRVLSDYGEAVDLYSRNLKGFGDEHRLAAIGVRRASDSEPAPSASS
jgi:class 3 adenylate cyclase